MASPPFTTPTSEQVNIINRIGPFIKKLAETLEDFPEGFCDVTTAFISSVHSNEFPDATFQCGAFPGYSNHIWLKFGNTNYDLTAHQYPELIRYSQTFPNGVTAVVGSDSQFKAAGYIFHDNIQCSGQIDAATYEITSGMHGDLTMPTTQPQPQPQPGGTNFNACGGDVISPTDTCYKNCSEFAKQQDCACREVVKKFVEEMKLKGCPYVSCKTTSQLRSCKR